MKLNNVFIVVIVLLLVSCEADNRLSDQGSFFESRAGTVWDVPAEEQPNDAIHVRVGTDEALPFESWINEGGVFGDCYKYVPYGITDGGLEYDSFEVKDLSSDVLQIALEYSVDGETIREFHTYFIDGEFLVDDFERYANDVFVGSGSQYLLRSGIDVDTLDLCDD